MLWVVLGLHLSRVSLFLCFDRIDGDDNMLLFNAIYVIFLFSVLNV